MEKPKETMLQAFLRQTEINDTEADKRDDARQKLGAHFIQKANKDIKHGPNLREVIPPPTRKPNLGVKKYDSFNAFIVESLNKEDPKPDESGFLEIDRLAYLRNKKDS